MEAETKALERALKTGAPVRIHTELCRRNVAAFEAAVKNGNDLVVACTQEAPLFGELHEELKGAARIQFTNIRETAGWSAEGASATPKIAALLALADLPEVEPVPLTSPSQTLSQPTPAAVAAPPTPASEPAPAPVPFPWPAAVLAAWLGGSVLMCWYP